MDDPAKLAGGTLGEYSYGRPDHIATTEGDRTAADVLKDIVGNVQEIIRSEVRLARAEVKEESGKVFGASKMFLIGAVLGIYGLFFILLGVVYGLAGVMSPWLAAMLVGVALAVAAGVLVMSGRERIKNVSPKPEKTIGTVKENIEWMKGQTKS